MNKLTEFYSFSWWFTEHTNGIKMRKEGCASAKLEQQESSELELRIHPYIWGPKLQQVIRHVLGEEKHIKQREANLARHKRRSGLERSHSTIGAFTKCGVILAIHSTYFKNNISKSSVLNCDTITFL